LSLTGTVFTWFSSLAPNSVDSWNQLEQKFHDHFFSGDYHLKLTDLTMVKQGKYEMVSNYLKRFKEVKNCCFSLLLSDSDLAYLDAKGLKFALRERLEGVDFYLLGYILVRGMAQELKLNKENEKLESRQSNVHMIDYVPNSLDDESEVYVLNLYGLLMINQEELKFTFDVSKCDRILYEFLKLNISYHAST
jgi:hypothetical protein